MWWSCIRNCLWSFCRSFCFRCLRWRWRICSLVMGLRWCFGRCCWSWSMRMMGWFLCVGWCCISLGLICIFWSGRCCMIIWWILGCGWFFLLLSWMRRSGWRGLWNCLWIMIVCWRWGCWFLRGVRGGSCSMRSLGRGCIWVRMSGRSWRVGEICCRIGWWSVVWMRRGGGGCIGFGMIRWRWIMLVLLGVCWIVLRMGWGSRSWLGLWRGLRMGGRWGSKEVGVMGIDFERDGKRVIWIFFWRYVRVFMEVFLGFCNSSW